MCSKPSASDIAFERGQFTIVGTDRSISIMELARRIHSGINLPPETPQSLDVIHVSDGPGAWTFPNGCHIAEVEVDPDTGTVDVVKYSCVNDFGVVVNPMIVAGQLHGGVVQGIGQALMEKTVYDEDGQLLTGSFMDYAMPRAADVPFFTLGTHPVPTKTNPLGVKGCGEAGCAGGLPSTINAVIDALADHGIRHVDMPLTPFRIWQALASREVKPPAMTQTISVRSIRPAESRLIAAVCGAHMMSHYYMLMLAPLMAFVRDDFNVSYTELALAVTVFNVVSGLLQTPVGFLVDRIGARVVLIAGLALSSGAFAVAGMVDSYWVFIAMYGVAGLGNTVYHPSDYSLLSHHAPSERLSHVFSFHTFAGMVGSAIAPVTLLYMQSMFGWRGAYIGAAIFGFLVLLALIAQPEPPPIRRTPPKLAARARKNNIVDTGWRLLLTPAILLNLGYFILTSIMGGGLNTYLVVALGALHATPPDVANIALTGLLAMNAVGVLAGGFLAARTSHHAVVAASGLTVAASSPRWSAFSIFLQPCSS